MVKMHLPKAHIREMESNEKGNVYGKRQKTAHLQRMRLCRRSICSQAEGKSRRSPERQNSIGASSGVISSQSHLSESESFGGSPVASRAETGPCPASPAVLNHRAPRLTGPALPGTDSSHFITLGPFPCSGLPARLWGPSPVPQALGSSGAVRPHD